MLFHKSAEEKATRAPSKEYLDFVLEQLDGLGGISYRATMGECILYCQGKVFGGIYDDRFLVKPTRIRPGNNIGCKERASL